VKYETDGAIEQMAYKESHWRSIREAIPCSDEDHSLAVIRINLALNG